MSDPSLLKGPTQDVQVTDAPLTKSEDASIAVSSASPDSASETSSLRDVPLSFKIASIILVSMIGFGGNWSSGITGAMKTKLKKVDFRLGRRVTKILC